MLPNIPQCTQYPQPPPRLSPGQQGGQVVRRGGIWAQGRGGHECRCLGPVLTPVVGAIGPQAGSDGLAEHQGACGGKHNTRSRAEGLSREGVMAQTWRTRDGRTMLRGARCCLSFFPASPHSPATPRPPGSHLRLTHPATSRSGNTFSHYALWAYLSFQAQGRDLLSQCGFCQKQIFELSSRVQVFYLGGDSRQHWLGIVEVTQDRERRQEQGSNHRVTAMSTCSSGPLGPLGHC